MSSSLTARKIGLWTYADFRTRVMFDGKAEVRVGELPPKLVGIVNDFDRAGISLFYLNILKGTGEAVSALVDDNEIPLSKLNELDKLLKQHNLSVDYIGKDLETDDWFEIVFKKLDS